MPLLGIEGAAGVAAGRAGEDVVFFSSGRSSSFFDEAGEGWRAVCAGGGACWRDSVTEVTKASGRWWRGARRRGCLDAPGPRRVAGWGGW